MYLRLLRIPPLLLLNLFLLLLLFILLTPSLIFMPGTKVSVCSCGYGHIVDPSLPVDPLRLDVSPALPPTLSQLPTPVEMKALAHWQDNNNIAQYVLVGRLGGLARQLLPPAHMGSHTAFAVYTTITKYFGLRNFGDCDELASSLLQSR